MDICATWPTSQPPLRMSDLSMSITPLHGPGLLADSWASICCTMQVQRCTLLSIKTGGCPETCTYCSQSSSWSRSTGLKAEKLMGLDEVYQVHHSLSSWHAGSFGFCCGTLLNL